MAGRDGFQRRGAATTRSLRRDGDAASVMRYEDTDGAPRPVIGDEDFPFVKDPPDIERFGALRLALDLEAQTPNLLPAITTIADYEVSPVVDVEGWRQLNLFLTYHLGDNQGLGAGVLSLYLQGRHDRVSNKWVTTGVVDPTLVAAGPQLGSSPRYLYGSELRVDPTRVPGSAIPAPPPPSPAVVQLAVSFDVSIHTAVRFLWGDLAAADASLSAHYLLQR